LEFIFFNLQDLIEKPEYPLLIQRGSAAMSFFSTAPINSQESILWRRIGKSSSQVLNNFAASHDPPPKKNGFLLLSKISVLNGFIGE